MKFNGYFENGIRCITIETPGKYKDQETTLKVRISEIPDSVEMKIEYLVIGLKSAFSKFRTLIK